MRCTSASAEHRTAVLEVLVIDGDTPDARNIHAHKARKHYLKKLP